MQDNRRDHTRHQMLSEAGGCRGHPRLVVSRVKDVDSREKPGHDAERASVLPADRRPQRRQHARLHLGERGEHIAAAGHVDIAVGQPESLG